MFVGEADIQVTPLRCFICSSAKPTFRLHPCGASCDDSFAPILYCADCHLPAAVFKGSAAAICIM